MAQSTRDRVFLSYAHEDLDTVHRIYSGLKQRQLNVWFDKENLKPGEWMLQIEKAIPRSRYFIICISNAALRKTGDDETGFIDKELNAAYKIADRQPSTEFAIVPVRLEACDRAISASPLFSNMTCFRILRLAWISWQFTSAVSL